MQGRHEYKHSLNFGDYIILSSRMSALLARDPHCGADGRYRVRSLYFDTPGDKALMEKINGTDRREKFRLRRYPGNHPANGSRIMLEKKSKIHGLCYKESAELSMDEAQRLIAGNMAWAADEAPLKQELAGKMKSELLRAKTVVEYMREPFICKAGNVRVTFDSGIRTGILSTDFLSDGMPLLPAGNEIVLLEVKYDQFIPGYILAALQIGSRMASACSKYALCRVYG